MNKDFFYMEAFIKAFVEWMEVSGYKNHPNSEYSSFTFKFTKREGHYRIEPSYSCETNSLTIRAPILFTQIEDEKKVEH